MKKSCIMWKEKGGEISVGVAFKEVVNLSDLLRAYINKKPKPLRVFAERTFTDVKEAEAWKEYLIRLSSSEVSGLEMDKVSGAEKWYQR